MDDEPAPKRVRLNEPDLERLSKDDLITKWKKQEAYITALENKTDLSDHNAAKLSEMEDRLHQQQLEFAVKERKDRLLVMRLATKEQELQELANQLSEMTKGQAPGSSQLRSALLDPALNLIFQRMRKELEDKTKALQQAQDDMSAWKFTADSQMGKRLMSRCRTLIQENQELGKQVSAGRTARLETELALQKKYSEELKGSQDELNEFVIDLDEEVVGMQSTICALQQQLKDAKQELQTSKQTSQKSVVATISMPPPEPVEEPPQRTIKEERTEWTMKEVKKDHKIKKEWTQRDDEAQAYNEPSRQSGEVSQETSWTAYDKAAGEKSPSTPTEEEPFRIPEAPKTLEMAPTSPAIPEEASAAPGPQEEARTSSSIEEQPMDVDTSWIKREKERTFPAPPRQAVEQMNFRTTDGASSDVMERTQDIRKEMSAEAETPMETEPVPEPRAAQELQDNQVKIKMEKADDRQEQQAGRTEDAVATDGEVFNSQGVEDSKAATPIEATNGNTRTEVNEPAKGIETGSVNHNTKNGEFSPTNTVSPPQSSVSNNQDLLKLNCNNSPSSNNIEEDGMSQTTEDGTETNSSDTLHNSDSVASETTDRTNSPVKQIVVKSNDGEGLTGGGVGEEKGHNVMDVPPLKENGPEAVSN